VDSKPLALLALIVLATEAMLGLSLGGGKPEDRFATILTMVALLVLVIVAMIIMVLKKPDLFGKESGSGLREPSEPAQAEKDQLVQKHKRLVVDRSKAVADIGLENPFLPSIRRDPHGLARIDRRFLGPESVARLGEPGFEDRLKNQFCRRHHHPVGHSGNR